MTISPNGTRVLKALDFDFVKVGGVHMQYLRVYDASTFTPLAVNDFGDARTLFGAPHEAMHRQDLHGELERLALLNDVHPEVPAKLHMGVRIVRIDTESAEIEVDDGRIFSGDLLIGADGIHSAVRAAAIGKEREPIDTEWQIYRFLLAREKVMDDPVMRNMKVENSRLVYNNPDPKRNGRGRFVWYECRK